MTPRILTCIALGAMAITARGAERFNLNNAWGSADFDATGLVRFTLAQSPHSVVLAGDSASLTVNGEKLAVPGLKRVSVKRQRDRVAYTYAAGDKQLQVIYELRPDWGFVSKQLVLTLPPNSTCRVDTIEMLRADVQTPIAHEFKASNGSGAIFNAALDEKAIAALATAKPDTGALGVETTPVFAGTNCVLDGTKPVVTPQHVGISGNAPWTMSVWVKGEAGHASPDNFGLGILGWGKSSPNAGNFLYHRPEGEAVFGFYSNDDRAPTGESTVTRSIVWLPEPKKSGSSEGAALRDSL